MKRIQLEDKPFGVIGAGIFGTTIANLLAKNAKVLLYSRRSAVVTAINDYHRHKNIDIHPNVRATLNVEEMAKSCTILFPIVPSKHFRDMMKELGPHLRPYHFLIHGTKGFDIQHENEKNYTITRKDVSTMSEVILEESVVLRVGCLAGPNLAPEIIAGQPAATVIASKYTEVIHAGQIALQSSLFHVYGSPDLLGTELAGALKNIIAIGAGILGGLDMGHNIRALLVSRGLAEMVHLGKAMGTTAKPFLGVAGIGDLVATAASVKSRNFTFGVRLAKGQKLKQIEIESDELAEGVRTLKVAKAIADEYKIHVPIIQTLHKVVFDDLDIKRAINYLMHYPYSVDVDFL